ncbi:MAG: hypothetical protein A3B99_03065 [Candidatus Yanofskybacteria bacterium RIFCSPHIGHO2_02_FULL_44_12b]|uniref:PilN domain-containing protein n=2 Tax=Candidatus Yanofskyibacteriota TaxID=1752733 RepID=A0A1F8GM82_9BACT|nr:MAG: hypothetical protein UW79_C0005G0024 [Candidatus Yanofskybacteria bacterium GW2011_GWA2_44_9]OGN05505.1 MAG: hypothetical protein A2659_02840 [Candidatus Yanofskybacteria bacterium RIFCSPHIGHO2_01_FULL_44_24]OGN15056.1 MAG: hypothetical protein A3B99_03065 [Candidatus Yanofskybacteria bacterium RIFCSPHIGHO2_02_FULL_44_12b]OGN26525.1 MAG: hypothetical protein A2925_03210 [Candidatus Yanofskybacteria bacterium RIFCSPLOWO2_01_FULL_44_22]
MPDIGGIQLLPETRKDLKLKRPGENKFLYIGIAILSVVVVLALGLTFYKMGLDNKITDLNQRFGDNEQRRDKNQERDLRIAEIQLKTISTLVKNHALATTAFDKIASLLNKQARAANFSLEISRGKISMKVEALNYMVVARQIASFLSDDFIKKLTIGKITLGTNGKLEFGVEIDFDKSRIIPNHESGN